MTEPKKRMIFKTDKLLVQSIGKLACIGNNQNLDSEWGRVRNVKGNQEYR
jgi:hypothetical protein